MPPRRSADGQNPERPPPDTTDYIYWISRFSYDEIVEIAAAMWPDDADPRHHPFTHHTSSPVLPRTLISL